MQCEEEQQTPGLLKRSAVNCSVQVNRKTRVLNNRDSESEVIFVHLSLSPTPLPTPLSPFSNYISLSERSDLKRNPISLGKKR